MSLIDNLKRIYQEAENEFEQVKTKADLDKLKIKYLSRKSYLANFPSLIKKLDLEEKRRIGKLYNELKEKIYQLYLTKKEILSALQIKFDFEHPGKEIKIGKEHLISQTLEEISKIFTQLGFSVVDYNQIVDEKENFDYLNIPENHPARDLWDTLWVKSSHLPSLTSHLLFRTHTSVFQIPILKKLGVSVRAVIMGKVFRYEATDKTHDFEFYQLDGLSVSKNSNLANLRYVVEKFFERFFHQEIKVRFRPGYFPFVEPGLEIDLGCIFCNKIRTDANLKRTNTNITRTNTNLKRTNANQVCDSSFPVRDSLYGKVRESSFQVLDGSREKDCPVCKNSGFVEIAGAGMVHNFVLKSAGIDYKKYQGYAFGFGVDRLIMLKHNIDDIRILHSSDLRFIRQL